MRCLSSLCATAQRSWAASSSSLAPLRSGVFRSHSRREKRQVRSCPSAVSRIRSQVEQKGSETGLTNPTSPLPSANPKRRAVDEAFDGSSTSGPCSASISVADLAAGQHLVLTPALVGVERHELDEADDVRLAAGERGEPRHLLLGEALDRDAVDLDRPQLGVALRFLEPAQHLVERVAPRDLGEAHVVERVEGDVDPAQARGDQRSGEAVEQDAVRRQREVADARDRGEQLDEHGQVAPDERLASRQPHLVDAHAREHADEPRDLLEGEHLVARQPLEPLRRHAVGAAEVALVGDRDAHALDLASPAVHERLHGGEPSARFSRCRDGRTLLTSTHRRERNEMGNRGRRHGRR